MLLSRSGLAHQQIKNPALPCFKVTLLLLFVLFPFFFLRPSPKPEVFIHSIHSFKFSNARPDGPRQRGPSHVIHAHVVRTTTRHRSSGRKPFRSRIFSEFVMDSSSIRRSISSVRSRLRRSTHRAPRSARAAGSVSHAGGATVHESAPRAASSQESAPRRRGGA